MNRRRRRAFILMRHCCARGLMLLVPVATILALAPAAHAHSRTASFSTVSIDSPRITWRIRVAAADLMAPMGLSEELPMPRGEQWLSEATAYVGEKLAVFSGEQGCKGDQGAAHLQADAAPPVVEFVYNYACPAGGNVFRLRYDLFFDLDSLHSGFLQVMRQGVSVGGDVFRQNHPEHLLMMAPSLWQQAHRFWLLGVEHIFTGYDHLAFLAGLLLLAAVAWENKGWKATPPRQALLGTAKLVTAFTLAHSLTLSFAALRPDAIATAWVEPTIALSVAIVGAENLLHRAPRRRWLIAFAFGLVHGFGFASVLQEIGLPEQGLMLALLSFNLGVECGQLVVVALVLPALLWLARYHVRLYTKVLLQVGSFALILLGVLWVIARVPG